MIARVTGVSTPVESLPTVQAAEGTGNFNDFWQACMEATDLPMDAAPSVGEAGSEALLPQMSGLLRGRDGLEGGLMTLCMLLSQNAAGAGPMASMLAAMVVLLSRDDALSLWKKTMDSDYATDILDQVDEQVFHSQFASDIPYQSWKPTDDSLTSPMAGRSAEEYRRVLDQFDVTNNPRYAPNKKGTGDTYCNIYSWDVTRAMNAEIPHYTDPETGDLLSVGGGNAMAMNANRTFDWLARHGERYGWVRVTAEEAQAAANRGQPAVTVLKRPGAHGHIQMVCPSRDGGYDPARGVAVAQAGSLLTEYEYLNNITSAASRDQIAYYVHA